MKKSILLLCLIVSATIINGQGPDSFKASDGETLYYTRIGNGPKVFLLAGGPGYASEAMMYWVDSLKSDYECILFDLRGTGHAADVKLDSSTVNMKKAVHDINDLRKHLNLEKITLCGISFGGALAQCYAAYFPDHVNNLVLVSTMGPDYSLDDPFTDNVVMRFHPEEKDSIKYWKSQLDKKTAFKNMMMLWLKPYFYDHDVAGRVLPAFFKSNKHYGKMSYLMTQDLKHNFDIKDKLKDYKGRCTIIRPRQDPIPEQTVYIIKEVLPQSQIIYIEKCGHFPALERPDIFFKKLRLAL